MKTLSKALMILSSTVFMASGAAANNYYESNAYLDSDKVNPYYADNYTGQAYIGAKGGIYNTQAADSTGIEDPLAYGIFTGYQFDHSFGAEAEYLRSYVKDEQYKARTIGLYGTYRHYIDGNKYVKGKIGVANSKIVNFESTEAAVGIGAGVQVGNTQDLDIEAEYSRILTDGDRDLSLDLFTVGMRLKF